MEQLNDRDSSTEEEIERRRTAELLVRQRRVKRKYRAAASTRDQERYHGDAKMIERERGLQEVVGSMQTLLKDLTTQLNEANHEQVILNQKLIEEGSRERMQRQKVQK